MLHSITTSFLVLSALFGGGGDGRLRPCDEDHALLHGRLVEIQYGSELHGIAPDVLAAVYRDGELFSAFRSDRKGDFMFNLPVGWEYLISFGGDDFVNRKVQVDLRNMAPGACREPVVFQEMSLFKPVAGIDYSELDEVRVLWRFSKETAQIEQDTGTLMEVLKAGGRLFKKSERVALRISDKN